MSISGSDGLLGSGRVGGVTLLVKSRSQTRPKGVSANKCSTILETDWSNFTSLIKDIYEGNPSRSNNELRSRFKELLQSDINMNVEEEPDAVARRKLNKLGSKKKARNEPSSTRKTMSWLWTVNGGPGEDNEQLHESVRVEWSKAKARRDRWQEEVEILREEMRRVLRMLHFVQSEWRERAEARTSEVDPELRAGLKAYALRQAYIHGRIALGFRESWSQSVATAVRETVRRDGTVYPELPVGSAGEEESSLGLEQIECTASEE
ncbi:hypothetical protein B0H12DRAFT_1069883 [Mycena haematopus]|nr:hypothetical protein B0H12DRAFT_1069883 [Mycena haematopus]